MYFVFVVLFSIFVQHTLAEKCETSGHVEGEITVLTSCPNLLEAFANPTKKTEEYLKGFILENGTDPKVCCGPISSEYESSYKKHRIDYFAPLSGKFVNNNDVPWLAAIRAHKLGSDNEFTVCSGVLINGRYVITAAECILKKDYVVTKVQFMKAEGDNKTFPESFKIEEKLVHPFYDIVPGFNNIALLRLERTIPQLGGINSILLPSSNTTQPAPGEKVRISNWNTAQQGIKLLSTLVLSEKDCEDVLSTKNLTKNIGNHQQCTAAVEHSKDISCKESAGSPVVFVNSGKFYLDGILSEELYCDGKTPQVYTKISSYHEWLQNNVKSYPDSCTNGHIKDGECVPINKCPKLIHRFANPPNEPEYNLHEVLCSSKTKSVCCPKWDKNYTETEHVTVETNLTNLMQCGVYKSGKEASYVFPWTVEIRGVNAKPEKVESLCNGVLINGRYILTTAGCLAVNKHWDRLVVRLGFADPQNKKECFGATDIKECNILEIGIKEKILHPYYSTEHDFNNVALLKTVFPIEYTEYISPICMPVPSRTLSAPLEKLHVTEWNSNTNIPVGFTTKKVSNEDCKILHSNVTDGQIVTMYDMCTEQVLDESINVANKLSSAAVLFSDNNKWYLEGFGYKTNMPKDDLPVLHSKVSNYLGWIENNLKRVPCLTPEGEDGEAVNLRDCTQLINVFAEPRKSDEEYLRKFIVGFSGANGIRVCCGISKNFTINVKEATLAEAANIRELKGIKQYCGYQHSDDYFRDNNGTSIDEFPWFAAIRAFSHNTKREFTICGGALITGRYVLTAAQCVSDHILKHRELVTVRLGEFFVDNATDCVDIPLVNARDCSDFEDYGIEEKLPHPFFSGNQKYTVNDIGLIRLNKTVIYTDYIRPLCLPSLAKVLPTPGDKLYTTGFGEISHAGEKAKVKKRIITKLISNKLCREKLVEIEVETQVTDYDVCTIDSTTGDSFSCRGDAGGPVMFTISSQWYLQGLASRGVTCGKGYPEVHTKVTSYLKWIRLNMRPWQPFG